MDQQTAVAADDGSELLINLKFAADDVAATRFTISPLHETIASLFPVYMCPDSPPTAWARPVRRLPDLDHAVLRGLISPISWIPDFVTPAPMRARPAIDEQLAQVRATPAETVLDDFHVVYPDGRLPAALVGLERDPIGVRDRIADALTHYWEVVIAPRWPRMRAILEADLLYRGVQCAEIGPGAAFDRIDPQIHWTGSSLNVNIAADLHRAIAPGTVVQLIPSVIMPGPVAQIDIEAAPVVQYRARRAGFAWRDATPVSSAAICNLLGRRRAGVLAALDQPRSTSEIARLLDVTPSAVSQHLAVLSVARLVERARVGRVVLYSQSPLAQELLTGSAWVDDEYDGERSDLTA
ncbi:MAG TPA: helix-turn-helix domain-containing protein [Mycobacteriales bacterium]|nr:helix-turn-helix domain-containing protein [Mycobacteriales bacterium]